VSKFASPKGIKILKKQLLIAVSGLALVILLFLFGKTSEPPKPVAQAADSHNHSFDIEDFIKEKKASLSATALAKMDSLEKRGSGTEKLLSLANFWKDSTKFYEPALFYQAEAAKLDNSEKNLNFAAQLFLEWLRVEKDEAKLEWETAQAIDLFQRAIKIDPQNDDLRIGLGSCYIYGYSQSSDPQQTLKGIQEILTVARKDSNNMKAQLMLGVGGMVSGQYDKAIARFNRVVKEQPTNLEAIAYLADAYAAAGKRAEAINWYTISKRLANNPHYSEEVDKRIKSLQ